jgi:hypothetical protein
VGRSIAWTTSVGSARACVYIRQAESEEVSGWSCGWPFVLPACPHRVAAGRRVGFTTNVDLLLCRSSRRRSAHAFSANRCSLRRTQPHLPAVVVVGGQRMTRINSEPFCVLRDLDIQKWSTPSRYSYTRICPLWNTHCRFQYFGAYRHPGSICGILSQFASRSSARSVLSNVVK